ncbi:hypothetical protein GXM_08329 [Nostoc sphaeroides CCNUC1]|uniref:Uncharacterized protein n=1 Tax=Nostoc sphaeroides CCNUC1 TaxID=2653204 RepID=A0A5P8WDE3_9NOSO|nr:hypothetical protein GXM_08329 [Nostoc sphaeroides CCNUC1]
MKSAVWLSKISLLIIVLIVNCQTLNHITKDFCKSSSLSMSLLISDRLKISWFVINALFEYFVNA